MSVAADLYRFIVLAIDSCPHELNVLRDALSQQPLRIVTAANAEQGWGLFVSERPQLIIADISTPTTNGLELLHRLLTADPAAEIILTTSCYTPESAVQAIKNGAADYLTKPVDLQRLRQRVGESIAEWQRRSKALQLDRELVDNFQLEGIVGRSPVILEVFSSIRRVAPHFRTALITGATGTGKEKVARALHKRSPARDKKFAVLNCSALPETLLESELFGYVRGAFTGAAQNKVGLFEYAEGGTVFLDEIGDMSLAGQAKLLRVLQNQEIQRIGSPITRKVDIRVIAATNRDLRAMVAEKSFREDLYYRLSMVEIKLPALLARREDIPLLQRHFIEKFSAEYKKDVRGITRRVQQVFSRYWWPGNIREMENVIGSACMMTDSTVIDVADLPEYLRGPIKSSQSESFLPDDVLSMEEIQRRHALKILRRVGGNKLRAAEILGISRRTLYNILERSGSSEENDQRLAGA